MKVLIVTKHFYPDQNPRAFRSFELARELVAQGHRVTIYTAISGYDYNKLEDECGFEVKSISGLQFVKMRRDKPNKASFFDTILNRFFGRLFHFPEIELTYRIPKVLKAEEGYDLLISIALPFTVHWGCAIALDQNRNLAKTWIADCGDPFMGNTFSKYPFYFRYVERWFCNKVDFLAVPTKNAINAYEQEFNHKIKVIPQGFRFDVVSTGRLRNCQDIKNKIPVFAYAGTLYKDKRDPRLFLEYLSSIDSEFKFILYTNSTGLITPFMQRLGNKVEIRNLIKREQLLEELSSLDFLVNFENTVAEQSPSKLIDYAITGLPILSIPSKEIDPIIINEFLNGNYQNRFVVKDLEQYNIQNVARQFIDLHAKSLTQRNKNVRRVSLDIS